MGMQRQQARPTQTVEPTRYRSETAYQKPSLMQTPLHPILRLQRKASCSCGGGCPECQAKPSDLKISQPSDPAEIEADQIADQVMRMPVEGTSPITNGSNAPNSIHRKCDACEDEEQTVQRKALPSGGVIPTQSPAHVQSAIGSGGQPLDPSTRAYVEPRFGHDFGHVRVHTDSKAAESARAVNARAYTVGRDVVFGAGQYAPGTSNGRRLIAHELTHVVQQGVGIATDTRGVALQREPDTTGTPSEPASTERKDVVLLMADGLAAEAVTLAPNATTIKVGSLDDMAVALKGVKQPINRLFIIAHSLESGDLCFETDTSLTCKLPTDIAVALSGTVSAANAPEVVDFRGCSIGSSPSSMDEIRAALGAKSAIGGNCFMIVQSNGPVVINGKNIVRPSQITTDNRKAFKQGLSMLLDNFGKAKNCVLDNSEQAYFRAGGKLVSAWMSPELDTSWDERKSRCYKSLTPEVVNPSSTEDFSPGPEGQCRLIKVNKPAGK